MKNNATKLIVLILLIITGFSLGVFIYQKNASYKGAGSDLFDNEIIRQDESGEEEVILPSATFAPITDFVKSIDDDNITITGQGGDMIVPKDSDMVRVFQRSEDDLIPSDFSAVRLDQRVTLKIIIPGKEAELILEE